MYLFCLIVNIMVQEGEEGLEKGQKDQCESLGDSGGPSLGFNNEDSCFWSF